MTPAARTRDQKRALRRHYAGLAMQALIPLYVDRYECYLVADALAVEAFRVAQAMIEQDDRISDEEA